MKKYISLAAGFVLFAVSACTTATPVADNATPPKAATPTTTASEKPPEKPKDGKTPEVKAGDKPEPTSANSWQDYKSSAGKFTVQVPSKPQEQSQEKATNIGTLKLNSVVSEANNSGYFVGYTDFPSKIADPVKRQNGLAKSVKDLSASIKGEMKSEKEYLLGDVPCRDFEAIGKVQTTDVSMKGRFCLADNRMYQVFVIGAKDNFSTLDVDRFITSFKIEK